MELYKIWGQLGNFDLVEKGNRVEKSSLLGTFGSQECTDKNIRVKNRNPKLDRNMEMYGNTELVRRQMEAESQGGS